MQESKSPVIYIPQLGQSWPFFISACNVIFAIGGRRKLTTNLTGTLLAFFSFSDVSYAFVWDNTQLEQHARHQDREHQNKVMLWANAYAARNRVPSLQYSAETMDAVDLPLATFLPSSQTYDEVQMRMVAIVERIIEVSIPVFGGIPVDLHIEHRYSEESAMKSKLVSCKLYLFWNIVWEDSNL
jgi:hypothetical protein